MTPAARVSDQVSRTTASSLPFQLAQTPTSFLNLKENALLEKFSRRHTQNQAENDSF